MHHAQLIVGSFDWAQSILPEAFRTEAPDVRHYRGARMSIDDVRALSYEAHLTPLREDMRTFVLAYAGLTHEAQNALLKLFEEPPKTAQFYIIIDREELLLPTVRSRLSLIVREDVAVLNDTYEHFFSGSIPLRLSIIADRMAKKDEVWARMMIQAIEENAYRNKNIPVLQSLDALRPLYDMPGASRKMILEHVALML